jgi:DNA polymerase-3 subunit delta
VEDFLFDLISGNLNEKDINDILEEGMNEIYLLNQVTAFVQQLFMIASYARSFGQPNAKEILGFVPPKQVWEKRARLAIGIKLEKYLDMLEFLNETELHLKTMSALDGNSYLQASLRKLSTIIR